MKKTLFFIFLFFISSYSLTRLRPNPIQAGEAEEFELAGREEFEEREEQGNDHPERLQQYLQGIKIREGETKPGYAPSYQFTEHQKASALAALRRPSAMARTQSANGVLEWKERGPGNVPGRTRGLLVDPDDATANTWYAGSAGGGIWKTTNGGTSWSWLTPTLPNLATTSLAMAASNHDVIYAGTGEGFGNLDGINGHGVFKSIDRGQNWSLLTNSIDFGDINRLVVDPATENTIVVVSNKGIYRSSNGGAAWTQVYAGIVQDIDATPGNFNVQYAAHHQTGVLKSIDGGQSWNLSNAGMNIKGRNEIAVSPVNTNRVFVSAEGTLSGNNSDLYISNDAGGSWSLVNLNVGAETVDFLSGGGSQQGWYDNTIACDPYDQDVFFVGGVGLFRTKLTTGSTSIDNWAMDETSTQSFLLLQSFSNVTYANGRLDVGTPAPKATAEIRFGPGKTQKAHRFLVPSGSTSGVADDSYSFQDYVDVPFEVWDVTNNRQLMVSFRDQNRNGAFDLLSSFFDASDPLNNSREYVYIQNIVYNPSTPDPTVTVSGGHKISLMYTIFPALASGATWTPNSLPTSSLKILYSSISQLNATTQVVADPYFEFDGTNAGNLVHPDHHNLVAIPVDDNAKTFRLLNANDGGVYLSQISTSPGTGQGSWNKVSAGYNTGQFYGVDKRPGFDQYFGGLQDNGSQLSPTGVSASATTAYKNVIGGDGFEVVWNNNDDKQLIGGYYSNNFSRSLDGGTTWQTATTGFPLSGGSTDPSKFPFISKLANSKNNPDVLFSVGSDGVWRSTDFGGVWNLTPIAGKWGLTSYLDVEVSRANANIVWAGAGMSSTLNLFVSTDNGKTFAATNNFGSVTLGVATKLASHPVEQNTAYALFSFAKAPKILRTKNLGQTWEDISGFGTGNSSTNGFPDVAVYSLYVRPDNPSIIWAGTEIGIVESLNDGQTWALLTDFPPVSVWDMKGQDDQVVIATHGRGIWTARIGAQQIPGQNPAITAYGTTPQSEWAMKVSLPEIYDSTQVIINAKRIGSISTNSVGEYIFKIGNLAVGFVGMRLVSYRNGSPAFSPSIDGQKITLKSYLSSYANYFSDGNDFVMSGFGLASLPQSDHLTLQTTHNYPFNTDLMAFLRQPIIVTSTHPFFFYRDIAIVQPGLASAVFGQPEFKDYVVVESTKDGFTWVPLKNGYNSSANASWQTTFNNSQSGTLAMEVDEDVNLTNTVAVGDTLLFRFRLSSNNDGTAGWGWSIDDLYIQQVPTGIEPVVAGFKADVYPNPTKGPLFVNYSLPAPSPVTITLYDISGRSIGFFNLGEQRAGEHDQDITTELRSGTYLLRLKTDQGQLVRKVIVH